MSQNKTTGVLAGKTYSLLGDESTSDRYYKNIREITNTFLKRYPDEKKLLSLIQRAGNRSSLFKRATLSGADRSFLSFMKKTLSEFLEENPERISFNLHKRGEIPSENPPPLKEVRSDIKDNRGAIPPLYGRNRARK
jgi:hypothetical protein